ncbi:YceI family protein [Salinimicrobium sp. GXAS 041]|uniref:YceI family protein n=1 Tax=Salinimicrobium sp. GXAS 041 TaxID=3400806 RepID=UPI003C771D47
MATTKWVLDPTHSELGFKIRHLMISNVTGKFKTFDAQAETEGDDFSNANLSAEVEVASIDTNNIDRDAHLKNADFFEVESYPKMHFQSTEVEKVDDDEFIIHGNLTIKETTKPVKLKSEFNGIVQDPYGNTKAGFSLGGKINRKDWGINYNAALETGGVMLGEELKIQGEVQLVKQ